MSNPNEDLIYTHLLTAIAEGFDVTISTGDSTYSGRPYEITREAVVIRLLASSENKEQAFVTWAIRLSAISAVGHADLMSDCIQSELFVPKNQ